MIVYSKKLAENYNEFHSRLPSLERLQINKISTYLNSENNSTIIDFGSGAGRLLLPLSRYFDNVIGVEKSQCMYDACKSKIDKVQNISLYNLSAQEFLDTYTGTADCAVFSYSLHQIYSNKLDQINFLKQVFSKLKCKLILLITASEPQFSESFLNRLSFELDSIDRNRYLFKHDLENNFNIKLYEEETNYSNIDIAEYYDLIENKYISTLQLLTEQEFNNILEKIKNIKSPTIKLTDYYTYILLSNE